jgi:pyridoxamine 5'-phosphate oxidase
MIPEPDGLLPRLHQRDLDPDPLRQFERWLDDAAGAAVIEPTAMTLATVDEQGWPDARVVLLKGADPRGFVFFTNYESPKAEQLDRRPRATLCFWWGSLARQVRVTGPVERVARGESEEYFATRPRGSQIGAWASRQSSVLESAAELDRRFAEVAERFAGQEVPCPPGWGGYRLTPRGYEFWQGRQNRLHDRFRYSRLPAGWLIERLSP